MSIKHPLFRKPTVIDRNNISKKIIKSNDYSAEKRWLEKEVKSKNIILNNSNYSTITLTGRGEYEILNNSVKMKFSTMINELKERSFTTISFIPNISNWTDFNRFIAEVYIKSTGYYNFYFHFVIHNKNNTFTHACSLKTNEWNKVNFEFDHNLREEITKVDMGVLITGCPPEGLPDVEVTFKDISIEKVKEDYTLGWNLEERFAFSHIGYFINSEKKITTSKYEEGNFKIYDLDNNLVYQNKVEVLNNDLGNYVICDFSEYNIPGEYYLSYGSRTTNVFVISDDYLNSSILSSLNFLYSLRCGEEVKGVHSPCHLNSYAVDLSGNKVPVFGGWHDAGDVSQFEICTGEMAHAVMDLVDVIQDENIKSLLKEEARVGLNWLLRTRFNDGYRVMGVTYSIWRDNIDYADSHNLNPMKAEEGAFENLIASAAEAKAYSIYKDEDPIFADWCLRCAVEDYEHAVREIENGIYTKRWGKTPESQLYGEAILTCVMLYNSTNESKYLDDAVEYAKIVMECQQREYPNWDIPLRGFFYENRDHLTNLVFEHRGHYDSPVYGLTKLCEVGRNYPDYDKWIETLKLFEEYIIKSVSYTAPYDLLPAGIYELDKINLNSYTIHPNDIDNAKQVLKDQISSGIKLNDGVYLRKMGVAVSRRGFHATLLSLTKAVSSTAVILNSNELLRISIKQIEWIMGNNPFSSSTMYGEGYNYHPLYVAFSLQMIGSLPVGIKTYQNTDEPYWPTINNAVFKEIWGHTTGKYLWVLADILKMKEGNK